MTTFAEIQREKRKEKAVGDGVNIFSYSSNLMNRGKSQLQMAHSVYLASHIRTTP